MVPESPQSGPAAPESALVLAGPFAEEWDDACRSRLSVGAPEEARLLVVTLTGTAQDCLHRWEDAHDGAMPADVGVVTVGGRAGERDQSGGTEPTQVTAGGITNVGSAGDLTGIGIAVSEYLAEWGTDRPTVLCFDSITTLLQYTDIQAVFRFLHVLTRRSEQAGARAHFHLDPAAHDDRTVHIITSLFDRVIEPGADGTNTAENPTAESG